MRQVFLGPWRYWLIWIAIIAVLYGLGQASVHVRNFVPFMFIVAALAAAAVAAIVLTYRPGERITRDPFEDEP